MLGHDQKDARSRSAWRGRLLAALLAVVVSIGSARERGPDEVPRSLSGEAVRLSADRVRTWPDADGSRWLLLQGRAAALQGTEGVRADAMAIHVTPTTRNNMEGFEVEVHAEGGARTTDPDSRPLASRHTSLHTTRDPKLTAFADGKIVRLEKAPGRVAILDRGFPDRVKTAAATKPTTRPPAVAEAAPETEVTIGTPVPIVEAAPPKRDPAVTRASVEVPKVDPDVRRAQDDGSEIAPPPILNPPDEPDAPAMAGDPRSPATTFPDAEALPDAPALVGPAGVMPAPLLPNTRRTFTVSGGPNFQFDQFEFKPGEITFVLRGGVNVVTDLPKSDKPGPPGTVNYKTVDLTADQMVIFTEKSKKDPNAPMNPLTGVQQEADEPLQIYMEGNVRIRQDDREVAGKGDEKVFEAEQAYYDVRTERMMALKARVYTSTPGLLAPLRTDGDIINQFRQVRRYDQKGQPILGKFIRIDGASSTGSRFPYPGYRFDSQSLEIEDKLTPLVDQTTGGKVRKTRNGKDMDKLMQFRAFNNFYYLGRVPVVYTPFTKFDSDFDPLLRNIKFQTGNVFGQAIQFDLSRLPPARTSASRAASITGTSTSTT